MGLKLKGTKLALNTGYKLTCVCCGCDLAVKTLVAYKTMLGFSGYEGVGFFLTGVFRDDNGSCPGPWTQTLAINRKTGKVPGTDPCSGMPYPDRPHSTSPPWPNAGTILSNTEMADYGLLDYGELSIEYTPAMLLADASDLLSGGDFSGIAFGQHATATYAADESIAVAVDGDSFPIAMRYTDNVSAPSFVQLGKLVIRPSGNSYCKIFYPLGSDVCTSAETISCEPDVEIEIDPPAEWGRYEIRCGNCHADLCA